MNIENAKNRLINNSVEISYSQRLAIYDLLEELEADKLEAYKTIVEMDKSLDSQHYNIEDLKILVAQVNKANKYIEQLDNKTKP